MSEDVASFLQVVVGSVFLIAAIAKAARRVSLAPFLIATGLPPRIATAVSYATAPIEGAVGVLLIVSVGGVLPAALATALSIALSTTVTVAYWRGVKQSCQCFGALDSADLSAVAVLRSVFLGILSLCLTVAYVARSPQMVGALWQRPALVTILSVVAGVGYIAAFGLLEQIWWFERSRPRRSRPSESAMSDVNVL